MSLTVDGDGGGAPPPVPPSASRGSAGGVVWDLDGLLPGGISAAEDAGQTALAMARGLAADHRGRVASYGAARLRELYEQYERLQERLTAAYVYAVLRYDADTRPPEHGALLAALEEVAAQVQAETTFLELEWLAVDEPRAQRLLSDPALDRYAHRLLVQRRFAPHRLTEAEERILTEKAVSGVEAWRRLTDELLAALEPEIDGERVVMPEALARLSSSDREIRRRAAEAVAEALRPDLRTRTLAFNTLLADHAQDDRLRRYPHWLAELNLQNEASGESVSALVRAVVDRYDIPRRWYRLKARVLGLERLADYDRIAPVPGSPTTVEWSRARELVLGAYDGFSPELAAHAARFFDEGWIDAEPRPGKAPGAYCASTVPASHPYLLMSFTGKLEDVLTLAHELGHGVHFLLAAPRGVLAMETPLTVSETASVFGETLTFAHLLAAEDDPQRRFALLARQLDEAVGTVFRQVAIHRFEDAVHRERRERGELSSERLAEHWLAAGREMVGDSMELTSGYGLWWSSIVHAFTSPGYVYAYAYGQLLALSIYGRYLEEGEALVPRYLELLGAGGSRSPEELGELVGVDLADPAFWSRGLELIERQLVDAEAAAPALA